MCVCVCYSIEEDWVLSNPYQLASITTDKVWWSLLMATLVFVAGHINPVATQAKKVDKKLNSDHIKAYNHDETGI